MFTIHSVMYKTKQNKETGMYTARQTQKKGKGKNKTPQDRTRKTTKEKRKLHYSSKNKQTKQGQDIVAITILAITTIA